MLAHVHIMKTAGQTICDILRRSFGANHCDLRCGKFATLNDLKFAKRFYPRLASISGHAIHAWTELADWPGIRFFTFVREPISRCLSHYQFDCVRNGTTEDFIPWLEIRSNYQTRFLSGTEQADAAIASIQEHIGFVGLLEDFDRSLRLFQTWAGQPLALNYRSRNVSKQCTIKEQILANPEYVAAMHELHQEDQRLYTHLKQNVYPQMVAKFDVEQRDSIELAASGASGLAIASKPVLAWSAVKRNCLYKPAASIRESLQDAA